MALRPNNTAGGLLAALREGSDKIPKISSARGDHDEATIGTTWRAEVLVVDGRLTEVAVLSPTGQTTVR